jgi:glutamyl/glutaminyl-tRNA synthetase
MRKIMDLMKIRIHFYKDMNNHAYFFVDPEYDTKISQKFLKRLKQPNAVKVEILNGLKDRLVKLSNNFVTDSINKACSMFLYESKDKGYKNEDVFFLLRFAVSGNPVGAPIGDICDIIGYNSVIERIESCIDFLKNRQEDTVDNME